MSRMLLISNDNELKTYLNSTAEIMNCDFNFCNSSKDPVDIISEIFRKNSTLLILDDDFIAPNSVKILESIKKVNSKLSIIFITSDTSIELGRKINNIGVKYYLMKPISEDNLKEFVRSVKSQNEQHIF
ncbi:MAG: response regulator [Ignavibacteriales bacterium]|nr:response regulator [Ignavibacteriales bacterium]MCB9209222.1 response regulator [Ignavibacteriales bacterium]MCB9219527.1 response regulator [Ignavibacteriales bacterium]